jgi:hypothetical protein
LLPLEDRAEIPFRNFLSNYLREQFPQLRCSLYDVFWLLANFSEKSGIWHPNKLFKFWHRDLIRKGKREVESGIVCVDAFELLFEELEIVNKQAKDDQTILRLSVDAKAMVKVGEFSRGGKTRAEAEGNDHDFKPKAKVTPYGIFLPELDEINTVLNFARTMTWKGQNPVVRFVTEIYKTGVKLTKQAMAEVENKIQRLTCLQVQDEQLNLGKWFVDIVYNPELNLE